MTDQDGPILKKKMKPPTSKIDLTLVEKVVKDTTTAVPAGYIGITYPTDGRLAIPKKLHFRDYGLSDVSKLTSNIKKTKTIISILNDLVLEDIDCADMHPQEVLHTRLMLLRGFYGPTLKDVTVYVDDTLTGAALTAKSNLAEVSLNIDDIECNNLPKEVTNKITITSGEGASSETFIFRFPKQKDILLVNTYIEEKYKDKEAEFSKLKMLATAHQDNYEKILEEADPDEFLSYTDFLQEKELERMEFLRTCQLRGHNDLEFSDEQLEDKLKIYVPFNVWDDVAAILDSIKFGFTDSAKCNIYANGVTKKKQTRRFSFREHHLIPKKSVDRDVKGISFSFS